MGSAMAITLKRNGNQCETVEMLKVAIVRSDEREVPLSGGGSNPTISRRDWPACDTTFGHNVSPDHTSIFIRKQRRAKIMWFANSSRRLETPLVRPRPQEKF